MIENPNQVNGPMEKSSEPTERRVTGWFLAVSGASVAFDLFLRFAGLQASLREFLVISVQGTVVAIVSGLLGPYFLTRNRSVLVRISGISVWLTVCAVIQYAIYWGDTCCGP